VIHRFLGLARLGTARDCENLGATIPCQPCRSSDFFRSFGGHLAWASGQKRTNPLEPMETHHLMINTYAAYRYHFCEHFYPSYVEVRQLFFGILLGY
jgi:hypothetical protein